MLVIILLYFLFLRKRSVRLGPFPRGTRPVRAISRKFQKKGLCIGAKYRIVIMYTHKGGFSWIIRNLNATSNY